MGPEPGHLARHRGCRDGDARRDRNAAGERLLPGTQFAAESFMLLRSPSCCCGALHVAAESFMHEGSACRRLIERPCQPFDVIADAILAATIRAGVRPGEPAPAPLFETRRTTVREALVRPEAGGTVQVSARQGGLVAEPSRHGAGNLPGTLCHRNGQPAYCQTNNSAHSRRRASRHRRGDHAAENAEAGLTPRINLNALPGLRAATATSTQKRAAGGPLPRPAPVQAPIPGPGRKQRRTP
jgi:hypothetical protein